MRYGLQSHDLYHLPLGFRPTDDAWNELVIAETEGWTVYDAIADPALIREAVGLMRSGTTLELDESRIVFRGADDLVNRTDELDSIRPMGADQSNSSVVIGESVALKLYRRIEPGVNPELEILRFLTERNFAHVAALEGYVAYEGRPLETTLALLQRYVPSRGDGWQLALDTIESDPNWLPAHASRLGEVTALLHNTLGSDASDPHFAPEEPSSEALSLLSASVDEEIEHVFTTLPDIEPVAPIKGRGEEVRDRLRLLTHIGSVGKVIRTHGDYHLAQALRANEEDWLDSRLRRRARAQRARAASQALAAARRRGDAALLRVRSVGVEAAARRRAAGRVGGELPHELPRRLSRGGRSGAAAGR